MDGRRRVLVLDADMVPSLTIARSLSRRRCIVDIASHTDRPLSSYSRVVNACFQYPDPLSAAGEFVDWLIKHAKSEQYDLVIPVTERTIVALSRNRERFQHIGIAMPEGKSLELVLDKSKTLALADAVDVPRPRGVTLSTMGELEALQNTIKYPVVLKPVRSIGAADGEASQLQVSYAFDVLELQAGCAHALRFGPVLLQEFFPGLGVGIELIANHGKIVYAFQHRRLHEVPLTGGGSSLRKSEPVMPALLSASERLITALEWHGVAMVEFKYDPASGNFSLMEINGRFWGSLPLAEAAGADFPSMLLDLELEGQVEPCGPYQNDVYCRLLSRDLHWYEAIFRGGADTRIANIPRGMDVFSELALFFSPRHRFDVQSIRDPMPGLIDIGRVFKAYIERLKALFEDKKFGFRQRRAWDNGAVATAVNNAKSLLFLCYGNINRSALAGVMIRGYAEDSGVSVASAGFHQESSRPADPIMIEVAAEAGLNLGEERSSCITPHLLSDSDVIFVMEKVHYDRLVAMDERVSKKTYLLGAHQGGIGAVEIEDPYGRSRERYVQCFDRISVAVDCIKAILAERSSD